MKFARLVPWVAFSVALIAVLAAALPGGKTRGYDIDTFGRLPALEGGRVKPIDSLARNALMMIRGKQSFEFQGRTVQPDEWLLDVMFRPAIADQQPIFVINDPDVLGLIGLKQTPDRYFPFQTLAPHVEEIQKQAAAAHELDSRQQSRFQTAVINLFDRIYLYHHLEHTMELKGSATLAAELKARAEPGAAERQAYLAETAFFRPLFPTSGHDDNGWKNVGEALQASSSGALFPGLEGFARLGTAYLAEDSAGFNSAVADLRTQIGASRPDAVRKADQETMFNRAEPFYKGMVIYVTAMLLLFASWLWLPTILEPTAFALLSAGAVVHTVGLVSRIVLQGRPPVTNLYSSAIFVGWGAVILGLILERMYRRGIGTAVAAAAGFTSLIVAHHLSGDGDTMEMMRAVLDSNFWLATHVITITIGYSGTFLAGALSIGYALRRQFVRSVDPASTRALVSMTYGIICFSLFFSFIGTVLGGIWADQSWGRFWGWDPKENGALLIVLWNAIILHARWGGYVREKGIMAMATFGAIITSLSWFGVNMLGVGLHSYGFMDSAFWALTGFVCSQLGFMALCLLPAGFWRSRQAHTGHQEMQDASAKISSVS